MWVARQLDDSKIKYDAQSSDVKEINDALQSASKRGTGNAVYPEYVAVVKDFVIVIEDKANLLLCTVMNNSYITIIKEKRTVLSRKRIPLNQNECTADFRIGVPFEQNLQLICAPYCFQSFSCR